MEKIKFELDKYADMHSETDVVGKDGTKITVRNHIPFSEKEAMAKEMAMVLIIVHDDSCLYDSSEYEKIEKYMIAKYYTNIDITDVEARDVADFFINNDMMDSINEIIKEDFDVVCDILWRIDDSITKTYEDDHSIAKAIRTNFGFLFTGEDITESIERAEGIRDTLFEAIGALRDVEREREEKLNNGKVVIGGNLINFAKKTE